MKIVEYIIVRKYVDRNEHRTIWVSLENHVNEKIKEGWQPFGSLTFEVMTVVSNSYKSEVQSDGCQVMVKCEDDNK